VGSQKEKFTFVGDISSATPRFSIPFLFTNINLRGSRKPKGVLPPYFLFENTRFSINQNINALFILKLKHNFKSWWQLHRCPNWI